MFSPTLTFCKGGVTVEQAVERVVVVVSSKRGMFGVELSVCVCVGGREIWLAYQIKHLPLKKNLKKDAHSMKSAYSQTRGMHTSSC